MDRSRCSSSHAVRLSRVYCGQDGAAGGRALEQPRVTRTALLSDLREWVDAAVQQSDARDSELTCVQSDLAHVLAGIQSHVSGEPLRTFGAGKSQVVQGLEQAFERLGLRVQRTDFERMSLGCSGFEYHRDPDYISEANGSSASRSKSIYTELQCLDGV